MHTILDELEKIDGRTEFRNKEKIELIYTCKR